MKFKFNIHIQMYIELISVITFNIVEKKIRKEIIHGIRIIIVYYYDNESMAFMVRAYTRRPCTVF